METSSLQKNQPHLESVLGALSDKEDSQVRSLLSEVDRVLLGIAKGFGRSTAGWEGTGLDLTWNASGQVYIGSFVSAAKGHSCVDFDIELRPTWCHREKSPKLMWDINTSVSADCSHSRDHGGMDVVHEVTVRVGTALDAAIAMRSAVDDLRRIAEELPLEHWLHLASDQDENSILL